MQPAGAVSSSLLALTLVLALAGPQAPREPSVLANARAEVARDAHQVDVYLAARERLVKERAALQTRADVLAAKVAEAKRNRGVLSDAALKDNLREALEVGKALEATDRKIGMLDRMMDDAVANVDRSVERAGRGLSDADRAALAADAARVHQRIPARQTAMPSGPSVQVTPGMDAEALRERLDLARDYEEKLRKEALKAEARIRALEDQQSMAGEARQLAEDRQFFDEEDHTVRTLRVMQRTAARPGDNRTHERTTPTSQGGNENEKNPTEPATSALDGTEMGYNGRTDGTGGNAPTPTVDSTAQGVSVPRTQTVVDERTFALLRESRTPTEGLSAAEELRRLKERRAALLKAVMRLKTVQEELRSRAQPAANSPAHH